MKNQIKKLEKSFKTLSKHFAILKQKCYNCDIQSNFKKETIMENQNKNNVFDVANYIINEKKVKASNLKINKLIYYCYAKHLVDYREKLFSSQVQAWRFGPVFPELYRVWKKYRDKNITDVPNISTTPLTPKQTKTIDYVITKYSHYDIWVLIDQIHEEAPWYDTFPVEKLYSRRPISDEKILKFYSQNPI